MRFFTTEGPVNCADHYCLPPLARFDLAEIEALIAAEEVLLAPRAPSDWQDHLPASTDGIFESVGRVPRCLRQHRSGPGLAGRCGPGHGDCHHLYRQFGCQSRRRSGCTADYAGGSGDQRAGRNARRLPDAVVPATHQAAGAHARRSRCAGGRHAALPPAPTARRLSEPPGQFPQSLILCGVRDLQDYRIQATEREGSHQGGSAFNIKAESLRLGDFIEDEVRTLLLEHTAETGTGLHPRGAGPGLGIHRRPTLAGQCPGL